jgi:GNAT superfamily N-acetyltransferase
MSLNIRAITDSEFEVWEKSSELNYANEKMKEGLTEEDARAESKAARERHLPKGRKTVGHHIYSVELEGAVIGTLWWGLSKQGKADVPWIFDVMLDPAVRGKGLGRRVMEWAAEDVRSKGFIKLGLHVFGHNKIARSLYESLGFETTNLVMYKNL